MKSISKYNNIFINQLINEVFKRRPQSGAERTDNPLIILNYHSKGLQCFPFDEEGLISGVTSMLKIVM